MGTWASTVVHFHIPVKDLISNNQFDDFKSAMIEFLLNELNSNNETNLEFLSQIYCNCPVKQIFNYNLDFYLNSEYKLFRSRQESLEEFLDKLFNFFEDNNIEYCQIDLCETDLDDLPTTRSSKYLSKVKTPISAEVTISGFEDRSNTSIDFLEFLKLIKDA